MATSTGEGRAAPPALSTAAQHGAATAGRGRGAAGPILAALVVLISAAPGLVFAPPLDRDEARFAQSSAQMLESGDFIDPRFQDAPRNKKPVGVDWLQAASTAAVSSVAARRIFAYRLPSLMGGMAAAAAAAWGGAAFFGRRRAFIAGAVLGCGLLLTSEAFIAKTDAVLCASVTVAMAGLARVYAGRTEAGRRPRGGRLALWSGLAASILVKGPVGPMVIGLAGLALAATDRRAPWLRRLSWRWGLLLLLAVIGPWTAAITVSSDGAFWAQSVGGDVASRLVWAREGHAGPPGYYLLLAPVLLFPATALLPAGLSWAWRRRDTPAARFAWAWLVPAWLVFEAAPTKLPHYTLPLYGALALMIAGATGEPIGRVSRRLGAALSVVAGLALAVAVAWVSFRFGGRDSGGWAALSAALLVLSAGAGAMAILTAGDPGETPTSRWARLVVAALASGMAAHMAMAGGLLASLTPLWPSQQAAALLKRYDLDPRNGVTPGPVAVAGYAEPSLVFDLGTDTLLTDGTGAAEALETGQPALVEDRQAHAFISRLRRDHVAADRLAAVSGYDYSNHKAVRLSLWRLRTAPAL